MPIADHILHMFELVDNALGLRIMARQFRDVTRAFADDSILMEGLFCQRDMISSELGEFAQRQDHWFGVFRDRNLTSGPLQALSYLVRSLAVESLNQLLFPLGTLVHESINQLRFVSVALGNFQAPQRRDLHIQVANSPGLLAQSR